MSTPSLTLGDIARQINESEARIVQYKADAVREAITQGNLLAAVKARLPHGEFTRWVLANCRVSPQMARTYLRLAAGVAGLPAADVDALLPLGIKGAARAVTKPDQQLPKTKPDQQLPKTKPDQQLPKTKPDQQPPKTKPDQQPPKTKPGFVLDETKPKAATVDLSSVSLEDIQAEINRRFGAYATVTMEQAAALEHSYHKLTKKQQGLISRFARDYPEFVKAAQLSFNTVVEKATHERTMAKTESVREALRKLERQLDTQESFVRSMMKGVVPFMTLEEARMITNCLHPDRAPDDRKERYSRAFEVAKRLQDALARFDTMKKSKIG